jgi:hypothetical protein
MYLRREEEAESLHMPSGNHFVFGRKKKEGRTAQNIRRTRESFDRV